MSIASKLKLSAAQPVYLLQMPAANRPLFDDQTIKTSITATTVVTQAVVFAKDQQSLNSQLVNLLPHLATQSLLWVAYPKKSGSIPTDLSRDSGWQQLQDAGFLPVTQVAIDDDWSALRFKRAEDIAVLTRAVPQEQRTAEGIDYTTRTVTPPADFLTAMKSCKGMTAYFDGLAFTHRKEYVLAIVQAKKPETRQRRIEKTIEQLQQKMNGK